jgi:ribosomal protein L40E
MTSSEILTEPSAQAEAAPAPRRRLTVPTWAVGLGGAAVALTYAAAIEKMRLGPPLVMIVLGGMTLAFVARALWRVLDPLTRVEVPARASAELQPRRARELEREKQLVLKAIKEVELDFQMRKVAERDYKEMVERYRTRALRLMTEIEAGDDFRSLIERELKIRLELPDAAKLATDKSTASATAASTPTCASCQTLNDVDAQFCKKCGAKIS